MKKKTIVLLFTVSVSVLLIILFLNYTSKYNAATSANETIKVHTYAEFTEIVSKFHLNLSLEKYIKISQNDGVTNHLTGFPDNLILEKRNNDGVDGDMKRPSKYDFYYLKEDQSTLYIISVNFLQIPQKGIVYQTIISPDDNTFVDKPHKTLSRPYIIEKLISCEGYCINMKSILLIPNINLSTSDNIKNLINENSTIYRSLERFIESL